MLKNDLMFLDTSYPNIIKYYTIAHPKTEVKINDIQNIDQINGIYLNIEYMKPEYMKPEYIEKLFEIYTYILENKILEKIFECCKITRIELVFIEDNGIVLEEKVNDIMISIFDIFQEREVLNYIKLTIYTNLDDPSPFTIFVTTISEKYYKNMPLRVLTDSLFGYFNYDNATPLVYFTNGIDEINIKSPCILKNKLKENVNKPGREINNYNKYIPLEYFRDCIPAN